MSEITQKELADIIFQYRGIAPYEEPCSKCQGLGVRGYSNTTTWRGGIGGQAITNDVCDKCWGSGKENHPWPSHRKFYAMEKQLEGGEDE